MLKPDGKVRKVKISVGAKNNLIEKRRDAGARGRALARPMRKIPRWEHGLLQVSPCARKSMGTRASLPPSATLHKPQAAAAPLP